MLSNPVHGWVDITIGDWQDRASYLTDVGNDLLDALIQLLDKRKVSSVFCNAEGWEYIIVFDFFTIYIITEDEDVEHHLKTINIDTKKVALELYEDISKNLTAWSLWNTDYAMETEKELQSLKEKLEKLKEALGKWGIKFEE